MANNGMGNGGGQRVTRFRIPERTNGGNGNGPAQPKELKPNDVIRGMRRIAREVADIKTKLAPFANIIRLARAVDAYDALMEATTSAKGKDAVRQQGITLDGEKMSADAARKKLAGLIEANPAYAQLEAKRRQLRDQFDVLDASDANTRLTTREPKGPVGAAERHILRRENRPAAALAKHEVASGRRQSAAEREAMLDGKHLGNDGVPVDAAFARLQKAEADARAAKVEQRRLKRQARIQEKFENTPSYKLRAQIEADFRKIDAQEATAEALEPSLGRSRSPERPTRRDQQRNPKGAKTRQGMALKGATAHFDV